MGERRRIPGPRDVRATLDGPADAPAVVVACPPHPQFGGDRRDSRVVAVAAALAERDVACLRIDYGPWDEGRGERTDVGAAIEWARERYGQVGLFGYSFGAGVALLETQSSPVDALAVLAPPARVAGKHDVATVVPSISAPTLVVYGDRDETVDSQPVVERIRATGGTAVAVNASHFFRGETDKTAARIAQFFTTECGFGPTDTA